jgi:hypothetical protein
MYIQFINLLSLSFKFSLFFLFEVIELDSKHFSFANKVMLIFVTIDNLSTGLGKRTSLSHSHKLSFCFLLFHFHCCPDYIKKRCSYILLSYQSKESSPVSALPWPWHSGHFNEGFPTPSPHI